MSTVKSFSVGNGDMFYIKHGSDNFTIIDCCINDTNKESIVAEIQKESKEKDIIRFISTHPDEDHLAGLTYLDDKLGLRNFYCVKNEATEPNATASFKKYCELRDNSDKAFYVSKGCSRKWMNQSNDERGAAGINFLWPITSNDEFKEALKFAKAGTAFNNISPIFTYSAGMKMMWMGDMEHDFLEKIKSNISWTGIDVLFAPHHGRKSGKVSTDVLKQLNPSIIVIGEALSKDLDYYAGYDTITQNSAGDITFDCTSGKVEVYVSNANYTNNKQKYGLGYFLYSFKSKGA